VGIPVSTGGGDGATWSRDGRELFFQDSARRIVAVSIEARGDEPQLGRPVPLFSMRVPGPDGEPTAYLETVNAGPRWDVLPDGRFVMLQGPDTSVHREIVVVQNWLTELARTVETD
jgi:hypothetical protein